jgi:hypothetical protein
MKRGILLAALGALLAGAAIGYFALRPAMSPPRTDREPGHATPSGDTQPPEPGPGGATQGEATPTEPNPSHSDLIVVDSPKPGARAATGISRPSFQRASSTPPEPSSPGGARAPTANG